MIKNITSEYEEQKCVVHYLELKHIKFTAIPNSTYTNIGQRVRNKQSGLRPGLPDLFMIINNNGIFIEMKKKKGGILSKEQEEWINEINKCKCLNAYVCHGFEEAKSIIDQHLLISQ